MVIVLSLSLLSPHPRCTYRKDTNTGPVGRVTQSLLQTGFSRQRGTIGHIGKEEAGEDVVMEAVLEDVDEGHGAMGETVDKEGFQLSLEEMDQDHHEGRTNRERGVR